MSKPQLSAPPSAALQVFAGKPLLYLNVMWKYLGQQSFHLNEREYLEHLEAIAQLLHKWDRVDHVIDLIKTCRKVRCRTAVHFEFLLRKKVLPTYIPKSGEVKVSSTRGMRAQCSGLGSVAIGDSYRPVSGSSWYKLLQCATQPLQLMMQIPLRS
eukprot:TRINITY_DN2387_c0_g1_i2.p1 TRINITY_DN2387_c0_g1~~TRINITY_DN2387_c0_g1_i2.p1  ORF type:complete len:155 (-),score=19.37 TRINITY_DN2387_c0_g1_i2:393-857(-)